MPSCKISFLIDMVRTKEQGWTDPRLIQILEQKYLAAFCFEEVSNSFPNPRLINLRKLNEREKFFL